MGSTAGQPGSYADTAKRLAGRSLLAVGSGLAAGGRLVAKGVSALTADSSDKEAVRFLKFALLEWGIGSSCDEGDSSSVSSSAGEHDRRLPVLLVGLATGFQVWRLDGTNPAELISRRDGPAMLLEALPEPRGCSDSSAFGSTGEEDALRGDRPLLAVVPAPERPAAPAPQAAAAQQQQQQHSLLLYSLRSHGYVRTLNFSGEVLGVAASPRLVVVALRGQLQAFDAATLQHTFSCLTYTPPSLSAPLASSGSGAHQQRHLQQQQFVTDGLISSTTTSSTTTSSSDTRQPHIGAAPQATAASLAPFALGARWLAYASNSPVPQASSQAVAQRLPLARRDSGSTAGGLEGDGGSGAQLGSSPGSSFVRGGNGLSKAAVADAALQVAAKGGQQLRAGLTAVGSASYKYLSHQYTAWRQGGGQGQAGMRDADVLEADAAVAGTVVVRDASSRLVVAHFRAHTSPLAALRFSPGGTLLATASVAGHSIHVFRIVPPSALPAGTDLVPAGSRSGSGVAGSGGHAVHLYRLHRGLTPAAIRGIAWAPDASWVAALSGRGTTHLFHTPAAAPGTSSTAQPEAGEAGVGENGVSGQPTKLAAVGRARKPGLLNSSVAGAATSAARNLYAGQSADAAPIAAAFLAAGPTSPTAAAPAVPSSSLYVVTSDGLLTRHLLHTPATQDSSGAGGSSASEAASSASTPGGGAAAAGGRRVDGQDPNGAAAAVLEETDRWDVARHASWPEHEELLPGLLAAQAAAAAVPALPSERKAAEAAEQQQAWVAQAEAGALAAPGAAAAPALWQDPQFRFSELQLLQQQQQQQSLGASPQQDPAPAAPADVLAAQLANAALHNCGGASGGEVAWLESIPSRPVQS